MVIKCPECNHYVSDMTKICPHCGFILKADAEPLVEPKPVVHTEEIETAISSVEIAAMEPQVEAAHIMEKPAEPTMVEKPEAPTMPKKPVEPSMVEKPAEIVKEKKTAEPQVERTMEEGGKSPKQIQCPPTPKASPTISTPVAPPPIAYQQAEKSNTALYAVIAVLALLICGVGSYLYYDNVYLPEKIDREAPRYYTLADMVVLRSSQSSEADFNKICSLPFGTELITYDYNSDWARVKVATPNGDGKKLEGFVARPYLLGKKDFFLLNSLFGNPDSREVITTTKCRIALLDYFKTHGYLGAMDNQIRTEAGISISSNGENEWQVFCKAKDAKPNSVLFKRLYNKNSQFTDFAVIIKNIVNGDRKLLYFYFDEDETPHLFTEQDAPREGYIKDAFINYNQYSDDRQLNVIYSN